MPCLEDRPAFLALFHCLRRWQNCNGGKSRYYLSENVRLICIVIYHQSAIGMHQHSCPRTLSYLHRVDQNDKTYLTFFFWPEVFARLYGLKLLSSLFRLSDDLPGLPNNSVRVQNFCLTWGTFKIDQKAYILACHQPANLGKKAMYLRVSGFLFMEHESRI